MSITYTPIPILVYSGSGANSSSTATSNAFLVQDYNVITVQVVSSTTLSVVPIQASNDDGMQSAILNWSTITSIQSSGGTGSGVYSITPGMRWVRFGSPVSACTVILAGNSF